MFQELIINFSNLEPTPPGNNTGQWYKHHCMVTDQSKSHLHFTSMESSLLLQS